MKYNYLNLIKLDTLQTTVSCKQSPVVSTHQQRYMTLQLYSEKRIANSQSIRHPL